MKPTNKPMKRLSLYLFLIFFTLQTPSRADDISEFQIEGMSIGDSLLDYFSEEEIKKNIRHEYYKNNEYTAVEFSSRPSFKVYDNVGLAVITLDKKFVIQSISGVLFVENVSDCYKKQKQIDLMKYALWHIHSMTWGTGLRCLHIFVKSTLKL